jgi:hypothetical protein
MFRLTLKVEIDLVVLAALIRWLAIIIGLVT